MQDRLKIVDSNEICEQPRNVDKRKNNVRPWLGDIACKRCSKKRNRRNCCPPEKKEIIKYTCASPPMYSHTHTQLLAYIGLTPSHEWVKSWNWKLRRQNLRIFGFQGTDYRASPKLRRLTESSGWRETCSTKQFYEKIVNPFRRMRRKRTRMKKT